MTKGKLSARQNEIYKYICSYSQSHGFPPPSGKSEKRSVLHPPLPSICISKCLKTTV